VNDRTADSIGKNLEGNGCVITEIPSQHLMELVGKTTMNLSQENQRQKDPSEPFQLLQLFFYTGLY
jgi:hypothetical protein